MHAQKFVAGALLAGITIVDGRGDAASPPRAGWASTGWRKAWPAGGPR
jgi:hypothetical protein